MNEQLKSRLEFCETDLKGALERFADDEELYVHCLSVFLEDTTLLQLREAVLAKDWDSAFTAAHAIKGLAVNMGFVPLYHAAANTVILLRAGKLTELMKSIQEVDHEYQKIADVIRSFELGGSK